MYERAASDGKVNTLLCVMREATLWSGSAHYLAAHQGGAPVFLASLYGQFRLRLSDRRWIDCSAAIIPPGLWHELDFRGEPFTSLYLEPSYGGLTDLRPLLRATSSLENGAQIGVSELIPLLRGFYEDLSSEMWIEPALGDLLKFTRSSTAHGIDPRLVQVVNRLNRNGGVCEGVSEFARIAELSPSRFQHFFTQRAGVPFRRYRAWSRLRQAWLQIAQGAKMTQAAHAAGFFDSAHLAHEYRRTFGKAATGGARRIFRVAGSTTWPLDDL